MVLSWGAVLSFGGDQLYPSALSSGSRWEPLPPLQVWIHKTLLVIQVLLVLAVIFLFLFFEFFHFNWLSASWQQDPCLHVWRKVSDHCSAFSMGLLQGPDEAMLRKVPLVTKVLVTMWTTFRSFIYWCCPPQHTQQGSAHRMAVSPLLSSQALLCRLQCFSHGCFLPSSQKVTNFSPWLNSHSLKLQAVRHHPPASHAAPSLFLTFRLLISTPFTYLPPSSVQTHPHFIALNLYLPFPLHENQVLLDNLWRSIGSFLSKSPNLLQSLCVPHYFWEILLSRHNTSV